MQLQETQRQEVESSFAGRQAILRMGDDCDEPYNKDVPSSISTMFPRNKGEEQDQHSLQSSTDLVNKNAIFAAKHVPKSWGTHG